MSCSRFVLASLTTFLTSGLLVACTVSSADATAEADATADAKSDALAVDASTPDATSDGGVDGSDALDSGDGDSFVDPRDGRSYPLFRAGDATWFAQNLALSTKDSSCYGGDDLCDEEGRLYPWSEAQAACPDGTHLGTDDDWKALEKHLGMSDADLDREGYTIVRGTDEGAQLKSEAGFAAKMAGFRAGTQYEAKGDRTYFWVGTTQGNAVWRRRITKNDDTVFRFTNPPAEFAISVRCVLD